MSRLSRFVVGDLQTMMAGNALESGMRSAAYVIHSPQLGPSNAGLVAAGSTLVRRLLRNARRICSDVGRLRDPLPTLAAVWFQGVVNFRGRL